MEENANVLVERNMRARTTGVRIGEAQANPTQASSEAEVPIGELFRRGSGRPQARPQRHLQAEGQSLTQDAHGIEEQAAVESNNEGVTQPTLGATTRAEVQQLDVATVLRMMREIADDMRQGVIGTMQEMHQEMHQSLRQEVRQEVQQEVRQLVGPQVQQHTFMDPSPSTGPAIETQATIHEHTQTEQVEVVDHRQRMLEERADMKAFQEMRPPSYQGERDFKVVDNWVARLEKIFKYLQCTDEQKVRYATFMLEGDAETWWRTMEDVLPDGRRGLTWSDFLDKFYQRYIPTSEKTRRAVKFASLVQGKMTVGEYEQQFRSLSKFVP